MAWRGSEHYPTFIITPQMKKKLPPWTDPLVYPDAPKLRPMSSDQIEELARDIDKNGLQLPIVILVDNRKQANGFEGPFPHYLLDP